jgi:hypothetical protein
MTELFRLISKMSVPSQIYIYVMMVLAAALLLTMIAWWIQAARWARSDFRVPGWGVGALHRSLDGWVGISAGRTDPVEAFRSAAEDRLDAFRATANLLTLLGLLGTVAGLVQISGGLPQILTLGDSQSSQLALGKSMGGLQLAFVSTLVGVAGALTARGLLIPISSWVARAAGRYGKLAPVPEEEPSTDDRLDAVAARLEAAAAALHALTGGAANGASPLVATSAAFERAVGQLQAGIQAREQADAEARRAWDSEGERRRRETQEMLERLGQEWSASVGAVGREWTGAMENWSERQSQALTEWTGALESWSERQGQDLTQWTRAMESSSQRQEHALGEWSGRLAGHGERMEVLVTGIEAGWAAAAAELAQAVTRGEERQIHAQERLHERLAQEFGEREREVDAQLQRFGVMWDASTRQLADRVQAGYDSVGRSTELLRTVVQGVEGQLAEITAASAAYRKAMETVGTHLALLGTGTKKVLEQVDSHLRRLADAHVSALQGAEASLSAAIRGSADRLDERMDQAVAALGATTARIDTALRTVEEDRARAAAEGTSLAAAAAAIGGRLAMLGEQDRALLLVAGELRESLYAADAVLQQLSDHLAALHAPEPVPDAALLP